MSTTHLMSAEELERLPTDGLRHELVRGEITTMSPSGSLHATVIINVTLILGQFVRDNRLGRCFGAEGGFVLDRDPDTVRAPDFSFVRQDHLPAGQVTDKFWPGAPDFAVEVLSPNDSAVEIEQKVREFLAAGTQVVWVVNPRLKSVTVYDQTPTARLYRAGETLTGGNLLPGLELPVARLFD